MPTLHANGVDLYYEISGQTPGHAEQGPPLVLITGLGFGIWSWYRQVPALSERIVTIAFDNRGVGASSAGATAFSIADMADDTAALIRHLVVEGRAHVLGLSMGGFIAQELALRHPHLVDRLILACTSAGLGGTVPATAATLSTIMAEAEADWSDEILAKGAHLRFSDAYIRDHGAALTDLSTRRRGKLPSRALWQQQVHAAMGFSTAARLSRIEASTLIMTGDDDPIVPPGNSELLAEGIPDARTIEFAGGRHLFFIEFAERFNREVLRFLGRDRRDQ